MLGDDPGHHDIVDPETARQGVACPGALRQPSAPDSLAHRRSHQQRFGA